jgi:hypothetical protein
MYFYPDNLFEEILILQNGEYHYPKIGSGFKSSEINLHEFSKGKWYLSVWDITNVLPFKGRLEEGIAAFPEEIPRRLTKLFTFAGETVLDPFLGSGTAMKIAKELGRNSYGYEIDLELKDVILKKAGFNQTTLPGTAIDKVEIVEREDAKRLRNSLQERVKNQRSVAKKTTVKPMLAPTVPDTSLMETEILKGKSGWEKLKVALPTIEAVEERLRHAKERNFSARYIRTLERLKAHLERQQTVSSQT